MKSLSVLKSLSVIANSKDWKHILRGGSDSANSLEDNNRHHVKMACRVQFLLFIHSDSIPIISPTVFGTPLMPRLSSHFPITQMPREEFRKRKSSDEIKCYKCHKTGHIAAKCPNLQVRNKTDNFESVQDFLFDIMSVDCETWCVFLILPFSFSLTLHFL